MNNDLNPAAPPPVPLWYDARFHSPPLWREVVVITAETSTMRHTAYLTKDGWRLVGKAITSQTPAPAVTWWCDCIPVPLPDARHERARLAAETRGATA